MGTQLGGPGSNPARWEKSPLPQPGPPSADGFAKVSAADVPMRVDSSPNVIATRSTKAAFWASADMFALGLVLARAVGASRGFLPAAPRPSSAGGSGLPTAPCPRGSRESDLFVVRLSPPWRR